MTDVSRFSPLTADHLARLAALVGPENFSTAQAERELHAIDQSHHPAHHAEVVVWPRSAEQVAAVLKLANDAMLPVTPWGVGTGLEGGAIPVHGGILLSLARMDRILTVHADDFQVTVEPGIGHKDLNAHLTRYGLFFPPDPGANASIGGMLANNAAGIRTVRYGASKDNVLRMQVALADGRLIHVGSRSVKQASGYDLLHLFVGSEGTLGVITQATLKLAPIPAQVSAMVVAFPAVQNAIEAVVALRGSGLSPAALEYVDAEHCAMLQSVEDLGLTTHPHLFVEFHESSEAALREGLAIATDICEEMGALRIRATADAAERRALWRARHASYEIMTRAMPGVKFFVMDVAVPISQYPALIDYVEQIKVEQDIDATMIGHAGDGNIHVEFPYRTPHEFEKALACDHLVVEKAIALGGTATGEHGVGLGKAMFMPLEHGPALDVMHTIKAALDPKGILNPGKVFPGPGTAARRADA